MLAYVDLFFWRYQRFVVRVALAMPMRKDDRCDLLLVHGDGFHKMYHNFGAVSTLEESLKYIREALTLCPEDDYRRPCILSITASILHSRFTHFGALCDLEEAFTLERQALHISRTPHARGRSLSNLGTYHYTRFFRLRTYSDIDEAISLECQAFELIPRDQPYHQVVSLENTAECFYLRFYILGKLSDLEEALSIQLRALELCPLRKNKRAKTWCKVALFYHARFRQHGALSDLDEALKHERKALKLRPKGNKGRATSLNHIALYLRSRFDRLKLPSDLNDAISYEREALKLRPWGHYDRAVSLANLASYLYTRSGHPDIREPKDLSETFSLYSQLSEIDAPQMASFTYLNYAKSWIQVAEANNHDTTHLAYRTFLNISAHHLAAVPSLPHHLTLLKQLMGSTAADAFSACVRCGKLTDGVEFLEQGRGVFWSQLIRLRSSLEDVEASGDKGRELAAKFTELAAAAYTVLDSPPDAQSHHDQSCSYSFQLHDVIADIRKLPGLSRFLQPTPFSELQLAAQDGPVVIVNASKYGCDALIVLRDRDPIHVALPITKCRVSELSIKLRFLTLRAKVSDVSRELLELLRALWDKVVSLIIPSLQRHCPSGSRIWWCPTAEFTHLPLHAAGPFRKGQQRRLADFYISSYTPTLAALIRARRKRPSDPSTAQSRFLIVGQAQALGQSKLPSVNTEVSNVSQRVGSVATLTAVQDQDANMFNVAQELQSDEHAFVHFACHGIPSPKQPFEAGFALGDDRLKVEHIMRYDLQHAQFAYLSACHTTVGDEESPDEVIYLAAAMQFAGFRSVIGTMWAVDDAHTQTITSEFYGRMMDAQGRLDHTRAARALHDTMRQVRSGGVPIDQQILYVHIGV